MKRIYLITLIFLAFICISCNKITTPENNTLYPAEIFGVNNVIYNADANATWSGITVYNIKTTNQISLCSDPICNHRNKDCVLFDQVVLNLTADDDYVYYMAIALSEQKYIYKQYNVKNWNSKIIYSTGGDEANTQKWCIYKDYFYLLAIDGDDTTNIYRKKINGDKLELVTPENKDYIIDFKICGEYVFYSTHDGIYRVDFSEKQTEHIIKAEVPAGWAFQWYIHDGWLYFPENFKKPDWKGDESLYAYAMLQCDYYRIKSDGNYNDRELVLTDTYGKLYFADNYIYYSPCDVVFGFSYLMPPDNKERTYIYNNTNGTLIKYNINDKSEKIFFKEQQILIQDIYLITDDMLYAKAISFAGVTTDENGDSVDGYKSLRYNFGLFEITLNGNAVKKIEFDSLED